MSSLSSLVILTVLVNHGFANIVLKIITKIGSGLQYWRQTSKK